MIFRDWVAVAIVGLFGLAYAMNPHEPLIVGALISAFSTAYGYYLGGSKVGTELATSNAKVIADGAPPPSPQSATEAADQVAAAATDKAKDIAQ